MCGGIIFLVAPGDTRKTFLPNLILAEIQSKKEIALAVALYIIASTLLDGGRTAHSALKLPLNVNHIETQTCSIGKHSGMAVVTSSLILWDECTMLYKKSLETFK